MLRKPWILLRSGGLVGVRHRTHVALDTERGTLRQVQEVVREVLISTQRRLQTTQEEVVGQHGRDGYRDTDSGGNQRFTDGARHDIDRGVAVPTDVVHRTHDSPDRPEQTDEGRGAADTGQYREPCIQRASFPLEVLSEVALQLFVTIPTVLQIVLFV